MRVSPNCKINLGLQVVGKRTDGYHDLQTIFLPITSFHDELEILEISGETSITIEGIALDSEPQDNLCMKAYNLLKRDYNLPPIAITLHKNIPFGAGLGGGSSDATHTLTVLNDMFSLNINREGLWRYARQLGADCPFFLYDCPCYAEGLGDILTPINLDLSDYRIEIEIPAGEHVSTKEAYQGVIPRAENRTLLTEAICCPIEEWKDFIVNDFEESVFPNHRAIARLKESMYERGALYSSMTGSGAAVFGIFSRK